jgi:hypothetical protein
MIRERFGHARRNESSLRFKRLGSNASYHLGVTFEAFRHAGDALGTKRRVRRAESGGSADRKFFSLQPCKFDLTIARRSHSQENKQRSGKFPAQVAAGRARFTARSLFNNSPERSETFSRRISITAQIEMPVARGISTQQSSPAHRRAAAQSSRNARDMLSRIGCSRYSRKVRSVVLM